MYNLISTITQLPSMVGCQEFPSTPQGMNLIKLIQDFINEEYKYSGDTVKKAFMLAAKQELYLDNKRIDGSTFGQHLSVNVVGKVLTAYKETLRNKNARPQGYNYNQLPPKRTENISDEDAYDLVLKWAKREGKPPFGAPYIGAYRYLVKHNQIKPVSNQSSNRFEANLESREKEAVEKYLLQNVLK